MERSARGIGRTVAVCLGRALGLLALVAPGDAARASSLGQQKAGPTEIVNGGMEDVGPDGKLVGWFAPAALLGAGYAIGPTDEGAFAGARAARIDSREATPGPNSFGNLMQSIDAQPWQGKRVRFRAAVCVPEADAGAHAQMWLRVDLASSGGGPRMGFFDNMGDRPIESAEWRHYEIVGDVAKDARAIVFGVLTIGPCLVRIDDATLEAVDNDVTTTGSASAMADAPQQPFFSAWLWLPVVALGLFALAYLGRGWLARFALGFTLVYWALYTFSTLLASLLPFVGTRWSRALEAGPLDAFVRWGAKSVLGIQGALVSAIDNGSGDSTYSYVQAFLTFALALALALVGSLAWWLVRLLGYGRDGDLARPREYLRHALRAYLAIYMTGYGLAKLGSVANQLPAPGTWRLAQPYGESSPMGLLWTFMGSSRAYTHFAGAMELLGAVLLVWRRTLLLGALASVAVMFNVMMMNFCYDVPVKLFSAHLVLAGLLVALPEAKRLAQVLVGLGGHGLGQSLGQGLGASAAPTPAAAIPSATRKWLRRGLEAYLALMVLGLPLYGFWSSERSIAGARPVLGEWKLATLTVDGTSVTPASGEVERLTIAPNPVPQADGWTMPCSASLVGGAGAAATVTLTPETMTLAGTTGASRVLPGAFSWSIVKGELRLESPGVHATFTPAADEYLLMSRGFRWINEHPFNR